MIDVRDIEIRSLRISSDADGEWSYSFSICTGRKSEELFGGDLVIGIGYENAEDASKNCFKRLEDVYRNITNQYKEKPNDK